MKSAKISTDKECSVNQRNPSRQIDYQRFHEISGSANSLGIYSFNTQNLFEASVL